MNNDNDHDQNSSQNINNRAQLKEEPQKKNNWEKTTSEFNGRMTNPSREPNTYSGDSQSHNETDTTMEDTYTQPSRGGQDWNPDAHKPQQLGQYGQDASERPGKVGFGARENSVKRPGFDPLNEPPLLEDLGINLMQIRRKVLSIISMRKINPEIIEDADLAGPILIAIIFGTLLLLRGKIEFGRIYGYGLTSCVLFFILFKVLVAREHSLGLYTIMSVLGY
eukprot:CAMPEP_0197005042 /NCGR_PEP_ID=MMETSP1380-20130617/27369_1 /TAXON_ID=5936 /ORGANISM="Euplotes crassus, Strain CT5" /LENGTH=221 /DNA_ID=CAMNT_0042424033 /DNA_START=15 /DNA_END=680 /DNA_ORIENTATION=+